MSRSVALQHLCGVGGGGAAKHPSQKSKDSKMTKSSPVPAMLSIAQFAEQLGVSTRIVSRWIKAGELSCHRFGRQLRLSESDIAASVTDE